MCKTNKEFRQYLNEVIGFSDQGKGSRNQYKARKRMYGDYLYNQDRDMFASDMREHNAGRLLPHKAA